MKEGGNLKRKTTEGVKHILLTNRITFL